MSEHRRHFLAFRLRIITDNSVYRDAAFLGYLLERASTIDSSNDFESTLWWSM